MKYLKKFEDNVNKDLILRTEYLDNLEDCLQEIFDKYEIVKYTPNSSNYKFYYIDIDDISITIKYMGQLEFYRIKSDINKLKQTIENRIGVKIGIEHDQYDDYLIIKPDVYKTLNEDTKGRMPEKCSEEEAIKKMNTFKLSPWNDNEKERLIDTLKNKNYKNYKIYESGIIIYSNISGITGHGKIFINKLEDNWFVIIINKIDNNFRKQQENYIADEFVEIQNFLNVKYIKENMEYEDDYIKFDADIYMDYIMSEVEESNIIYYDKLDYMIFLKYDIKIGEANKLRRYLNENLRFKDVIVLSEYLYEDFCILIIDRMFYSRNQKYLLNNLKWEEHHLSKYIKGSKYIQQFGVSVSNLIGSAKQVNNLPNGFSLIKNIRPGQIEFWPQKTESEPIIIYDDERIYLQYLLFKYLGN